MPQPANLDECGIRFLPDGCVVVSYPDAEVVALGDGTVLVTIPVAYYDEEWQWVRGGSITLGTEPQHVVSEEVDHWLANS